MPIYLNNAVGAFLIPLIHSKSTGNQKHPVFLIRNGLADFLCCIDTMHEHCQKFRTRWRLRVRTKAIMAAKSYKEMYGNKETFSNISIMSLRVFGARLETC